jgi:hypothetical protein
MTRSLLILALLCAPLTAQSIDKGASAPELATRYWVNPPTWSSLEDLRGDVVLIKAWGINDKDSVRQLPAMNRLAERSGLHVVSRYAQPHTLEQIEAVAKEHSITYPIALDGMIEAGYLTPDMSIPKVWVIGTDGKVKFAGFQGFSEVLEGELARVKYPGLGKEAIGKRLEPAVKLFVEGKYAEAYQAAETIYDETDDRTEEDDADWIMKRIDGRINSLTVRAETAEVLKDFELAARCWNELTRYKGLDDAAEAPARLEKLKESDTATKNIAARRALMALILGLDVEFQAVEDADPDAVRAFRMKCLEAYRKFAAENAGTGAAERADELVTLFKRILGIRDEPAETPKQPEGGDSPTD